MKDLATIRVELKTILLSDHVYLYMELNLHVSQKTERLSTSSISLYSDN